MDRRQVEREREIAGLAEQAEEIKGALADKNREIAEVRKLIDALVAELSEAKLTDAACQRDVETHMAARQTSEQAAAQAREEAAAVRAGLMCF